MKAGSNANAPDAGPPQGGRDPLGGSGAVPGERGIVASDPGDKGMLFDPADDKVYRHPTFYKLPDAVDHM